MPMTELPSPDAPLTQGDILQGVSLFATSEGWLPAGGAASRVPFKLCLVLSRPCVAAHKPKLTVAGVEKYSESVPRGVDRFDLVLEFLLGARDGREATDVFYLGQLPGRNGRYCARLDSLHTIEVPTAEVRP